MKKSLLGLLSLLIVIFLSKSCEKDSTPVEDEITTEDIGSIVATVTKGDWKIAHYFDANVEETDQYDGYVLNFNSDGILAAANGNSSLSGAWSISDSNGVEFDILFAAPDIFEELSKKWEVIKYTGSKIELKKDSGDNDGTYLLTFEKL